MQIDKEIKKHRLLLALSQEELADKLYVSRQSISNWETGKNYPDIHSLLLMSDVFHVSIDQLLKGDVIMMKKEIQLEEANKLKYYSALYAILLCITILALAPLYYFLKGIGILIFVILYAGAMMFALKIEKIKKMNDIQTYKEIVSFVNGDSLDEIHKHYEVGKRSYQKLLFALGSGIVGFVVVTLMMHLLSN